MPALAKTHKFGRMKPKYNPIPTAAEKRHHLEVMKKPCLGCGKSPAGVAHHPLQRCPEQRWRRDHEFVIEACDPCHRDLHGSGDEAGWCKARGFCAMEVARFNRLESQMAGIL